jgi:hypothetical protein
MRHAQRFAAAEGNIGDAVLDDALRQIERFRSAEFVAPGFVGP